MTTIRAAGEAWTVGLTWHPRLSVRKLRRAARDADAVAWIATATGTGLAGDDDGDPTDTPSLAAALIDHIADPAWIAVIDGGDGRIAMIRCESATIGDDGDIVADGTAEAARLLETSTAGYRIHASPSLGIPDSVALDLTRVEIGEHHRLQPLPEPAGGGIASIIAASAIVAMVAAAAGAGWIYRQAIMDWIDPPPAPVVAVEQEPQVVAMISTPALLAGCARALRDVPPACPPGRSRPRPARLSSSRPRFWRWCRTCAAARPSSCAGLSALTGTRPFTAVSRGSAPRHSPRRHRPRPRGMGRHRPGARRRRRGSRSTSPRLPGAAGGNRQEGGAVGRRARLCPTPARPVGRHRHRPRSAPASRCGARTHRRSRGDLAEAHGRRRLAGRRAAARPAHPPGECVPAPQNTRRRPLRSRREST